MPSHQQHTLCVHCGPFLNTAAVLTPGQWNSLSVGTHPDVGNAVVCPPAASHPGKGRWPPPAYNTINTLFCLRFCTLQNAFPIWVHLSIAPQNAGVDHVGFTSWLSTGFWKEKQGEGRPNMNHTEWLNELYVNWGFHFYIG